MNMEDFIFKMVDETLSSVEEFSEQCVLSLDIEQLFVMYARYEEVRQVYTINFNGTSLEVPSNWHVFANCSGDNLKISKQDDEFHLLDILNEHFEMNLNEVKIQIDPVPFEMKIAA